LTEPTEQNRSWAELNHFAREGEFYRTRLCGAVERLCGVLWSPVERFCGVMWSGSVEFCGAALWSYVERFCGVNVSPCGSVESWRGSVEQS